MNCNTTHYRANSSSVPGDPTNSTLKLAVPSDGELHKDSLAFLARCGLPVVLDNPRGYIGVLDGMQNVAVMLQRTADITRQVEDGSADMGIGGIDRFFEYKRDGSDAVLVVDDLDFGRCQLVLAVPDEWLDVSSIADLADLSVAFQDEGKQLRIATKYPRLVGRYLLAHDVYYFTLVHMSGALEAAPAIGTADLIADITSTGNTLRANSLKQIADGTVRASQACLIANKARLAQDPKALACARELLQRIEATLTAGARVPQAVPAGASAYERLAGYLKNA